MELLFRDFIVFRDVKDPDQLFIVEGDGKLQASASRTSLRDPDESTSDSLRNGNLGKYNNLDIAGALILVILLIANALLAFIHSLSSSTSSLSIIIIHSFIHSFINS